VKNEETGRYHLYITNVPPEKLNAEDIARTFAARWEVELMFKEFKSHFRLNDITSKKQHVVEALVYATILTFVVSRALLTVLRRRCGVGIDRTPERRWTRVFQNAALRYSDCSQLTGRSASGGKIWKIILSAYSSQSDQ
jgi:IS4 transposase